MNDSISNVRFLSEVRAGFPSSGADWQEQPLNLLEVSSRQGFEIFGVVTYFVHQVR